MIYNSFITGAELAFPVIAEMLVGYLFAKRKKISDLTVTELNKLVSRYLLPLLLFVNVYSSDFSNPMDQKLLFFCLGTVLLIYILLVLIVPRVVKSRELHGVIIHGMIRSNTLVFGIPLIRVLVGETDSGMYVTIMAVIIAVYNVLGIITMDYFCQGRVSIVKMLKSLVKNRLLWGLLLGLLLAFTKVKVPQFLYSVITDYSSLTTVIAIFCIGATFDFQLVRKYFKELTWIVLIRMVLFPIVFLTIGILLFHFRGAEIVVLLAIYATPVAVTTFAMAQRPGANPQFSGAIIAYTSAVFSFTIFLLVFVLKMLALI